VNVIWQRSARYVAYASTTTSYKFSQDHIETLFGTIRRRFGWNNNPTALQFLYAYRAILSKIGATPSESGNVMPLHVVDDLIDLDLDQNAVLKTTGGPL